MIVSLAASLARAHRDPCRRPPAMVPSDLDQASGRIHHKEHPAPYPVGLAERLIRRFSFVGDRVLDPFLGTATTSVVAAKWAATTTVLSWIPSTSTTASSTCPPRPLTSQVSRASTHFREPERVPDRCGSLHQGGFHPPPNIKRAHPPVPATHLRRFNTTGVFACARRPRLFCRSLEQVASDPGGQAAVERLPHDDD